ncbi:2-C-methyl-D-erythritol 4-phosphate cytidylyltransferase, chloroplastic-like protein, partial [Tanacetum coccineum]
TIDLNSELVCVHDSARPLVTSSDVEKVCYSVHHLHLEHEDYEGMKVEVVWTCQEEATIIANKESRSSYSRQLEEKG